MNNIECLNYKYNKVRALNVNGCKKEKKYLDIPEILILFKSIKEEYMFYLNLLIKDETNPDLLLRYLFFLKDNENNLEKENLLHEKFKNELEYYSIFFEKDNIPKV